MSTLRQRPSALIFAVIVIGAASAMPARAAITYQLQGQTQGSNTAVGTITTDGTIGTLNALNLVSWSLAVTQTGHSNAPLNLVDVFTGVTATETQLILSFAPGSHVYFKNALTDPTGFWQLDYTNPGIFAPYIGIVILHPDNDSVSLGTSLSSTDFVFATAIPELASVALLGLGGVLALRRRMS